MKNTTELTWKNASKYRLQIESKLKKQYNFTKSQLSVVLKKYNNNIAILESEIKKIEDWYKTACKYVEISINDFLFDTLSSKKSIL
jgi:hypothetical protein